MRTSWIMTIAATCGVIAFVYTLASGSVRNRGRWRSLPPAVNTPVNTSRVAPLPETIEDLEALIRENTRPGRMLRGYAHFHLARRYEEAGRVEDARAAWEEAATRRLSAARERPSQPDLWFEAGWSLWKLGRTEEAIEPLTEAEQIYSRMPNSQRSDQTWHRLGWARQLLGMETDAVIAWSRARELAQDAPDWNAEALYNLSCYSALLGEKEAALAALERSVAAGWNNAARAMHDADLASLRDETRFMDAVRKIQSQPPLFRLGPG